MQETNEFDLLLVDNDSVRDDCELSATSRQAEGGLANTIKGKVELRTVLQELADRAG